MWNILVLFRPSDYLLELLDSDNHFNYRIIQLRRVDIEDIKEDLADADALIASPGQYVNERLISAAEKMRLLIVHGSGYDKVDVDACTKKGVIVLNAPDAIARAVAEHALGLTISLLRKIALGDRVVRSGEWWAGSRKRSFVGTNVYGKTVGIIGLGHIGRILSNLFQCMGAEVLYWSRRRRPNMEESLGIRYVSIEELLRSSDIIIVSLALTPETEHFLDKDRINMVKDGAVIVNISRGRIIDEEALIKALESGKLGGVALDVFEKEPLPPGSLLMKFDNVVLTPHIAGFTEEAKIGTARLVYKLLKQFFVDNKIPRDYVVNPEVLGKI
jgi:phosphoglycerate dehydrogenase-like enzyme